MSTVSFLRIEVRTEEGKNVTLIPLDMESLRDYDDAMQVGAGVQKWFNRFIPEVDDFVFVTGITFDREEYIAANGRGA